MSQSTRVAIVDRVDARLGAGQVGGDDVKSILGETKGDALADSACCSGQQLAGNHQEDSLTVLRGSRAGSAVRGSDVLVP
ncbi:MAG: hypothetical protein JWR01_1009 [Subtercola sp.]|nr:hypothetical protein [Subtercola sp.]